MDLCMFVYMCICPHAIKIFEFDHKNMELCVRAEQDTALVMTIDLNEEVLQ